MWFRNELSSLAEVSLYSTSNTSLPRCESDALIQHSRSLQGPSVLISKEKQTVSKDTCQGRRTRKDGFCEQNVTTEMPEIEKHKQQLQTASCYRHFPEGGKQLNVNRGKYELLLFRVTWVRRWKGMRNIPILTQNWIQIPSISTCTINLHVCTVHQWRLTFRHR